MTPLIGSADGHRAGVTSGRRGRVRCRVTGAGSRGECRRPLAVRGGISALYRERRAGSRSRGSGVRPGMEVAGGGPRAEEELRDLEIKLGRKTPEGLLRWTREVPGGEAGGPALTAESPGLSEKIRRLRLELACLRAIDVQILQQLLVVNEGIESVKWLLEDRGTVASRCSSVGSSGPGSRRGSWSSQQDANDRLDSISIGSFLDTLADDLDEYSLSSSEPPVSSTSHHYAPLPTAGQEADRHRDPSAAQSGGEKGTVPQAAHTGKMPNGSLKHPVPGEGGARAAQSTNTHKLTNQMQLEYDAHWHWVQSQDDVTFL